MEVEEQAPLLLVQPRGKCESPRATFPLCYATLTEVLSGLRSSAVLVGEPTDPKSCASKSFSMDHCLPISLAI